MSLLNKNKAFSVRDYLFVAIGLLSLFWFFLSYSSNDPRSIIDTSLDEESVRLKAVNTLDNIGYDTGNIATKINFRTDGALLDSLQLHLGRQNMIQVLSDTIYPGLYPNMWEVKATNLQPESITEQLHENHVEISFNESGQLIKFANVHDILPVRPINRGALVSAFDTDSTLKLWTSLPDSAWNRVLRFNLEDDYNIPQPGDTVSRDSEQSQKPPHEFTRSDIERLGKYHLKQTGWNPALFSLDDIQITTVRSKAVAELQYQNKEPILGQSVRLNASVLSTGALVGLDVDYNGTQAETMFSDVSELLRTILLFLFGVATLIIFYFRIRARAIDTKPALVVSILAGLIIPAVLLLNELGEQAILGAGVETSALVSLALRMGFAGAFASVGFFVLYSVGDSVMRQYWPEKLYGYDYLRQGMLFNKPVGEILVRSVILSFLLCGIWSTLLIFFPDLYFELDRTLLSYASAWPPVYLFLNNAWFSVSLILGVFAVIGTQIYGSFRNRWAPAVTIIAVMAVIVPCMQGFGPFLQELLLFSIVGAIFTFIFFRWDFLTTLLSHFFFIGMLGVSSGWTVQGSPDLYIFITFCAFLLLIAFAGSFAIARGKERQ